METIKIKNIAIGDLICLLPIIFGMRFRYYVGSQILLPFNMGRLERDLVILGIPFIMAFLHIFLCVMCDISNIGHHHHHRKKKKELIIKSIVPVLNFVIYFVIVLSNLRYIIPIMSIVMFIFGSFMLVLSEYILSTRKYSLAKLCKKRNLTHQEQKFNRISGAELLILGVLFIGSIYLELVFSTIFIFVFVAAFAITIALAKTVKGTRGRNE